MEHRYYEFDRFRIDTKRRLLLKDGVGVAIKPKALDTLILLVEHRGRLLEKQELMDRLWPDTVVEETARRTRPRRASGEWIGSARISEVRLAVREKTRSDKSWTGVRNKCWHSRRKVMTTIR